jgi:hypothetical protein
VFQRAERRSRIGDERSATATSSRTRDSRPWTRGTPLTHTRPSSGIARPAMASSSAMRSLRSAEQMATTLLRGIRTHTRCRSQLSRRGTLIPSVSIISARVEA